AGIQRIVVGADGQQDDRQLRAAAHGVVRNGSIARKRRPYSSVRSRACCGLRTMDGVSNTITSLRSVLAERVPNSDPISGRRLRPGMPVLPLLALSLMSPASITVSPLWMAASVLSRRVSIGTLQLAALLA